MMQPLAVPIQQKYVIAAGLILVALLAAYQLLGVAQLTRPALTPQEMATTPVDVESTTDDAQLDDHLWLRLSAQVDGDAALAEMPDDVRAYYVTRAFEWEWGSGGITGVLMSASEVGPYVADGYRRLGLTQEAEMFDQMWSSPALQTMLAGFNADPDYEPSEDDVVDLDELSAAIGQHDDVRIQFVRQRPEIFSV